MSSFTIGGHAITFTADADGFKESAEAVQEFQIDALVASAADWTTVLTYLRSWGVTIEAYPGGAIGAAAVDYNGAGPGTLVLDNVGTFTALLSAPDRDGAFASGARKARFRFTVTG